MQTVIDGILTNFLVVNPKAKCDVLVLHGWGHNATLWGPTTQKLDSRYRYTLLDLPSFGATQNLPPNSNIPEFTEFIAKFIAKQKLKKTIVIGHSFGGQIALDLAAHRPNLVENLILIAPAGIRNNNPNTNLKLTLINLFSTSLKPLHKFLPFLITPQLKDRLASADYRAASPQNREVLKEIIRYDLSDKLRKITTPTLIIWCELDRELPNFSKTLAHNIKNSRLRILYGSDHNPHLNKAADLAETINHYLSTQ